MDDNQFGATICKCITLGVVVLIASIAGCVSNTNYQIRTALESKVDPLQVACAFQNAGQSDCAILASKR